MGFVVCEGSIVYNLFENETPTVIEELENKNINHVLHDSLENRTFFSSLHNENKNDDKIYLLSSNVLSEFRFRLLDECGARVINIYNSGGNANFIHLGFIYFFYFFYFIYIYFYLLFIFLFFYFILFIFYFYFYFYYLKTTED